MDLFLFGGSVSPDQLPDRVRDHLDLLAGAGLLVFESSGTVRTAGVVVQLLFGNWMICQPPQANPQLYLGEDSLALLSRLRPGPSRRALDLCSGTGLQALHCARHVEHVTAVELDVGAATVCSLNVEMNRLHQQVEVRNGDLYQPVTGRRFDFVSANPPTLPYPDDLPPPAVGHGGTDGTDATARILSGLDVVLDAGGHAQMVGMALSEGQTLRGADRMATIASEHDLQVRCLVTSHASLGESSPLLEQLVQSVSAITACDPARVRSSYLDLLARVSCDHLSTFFLHVTAGPGRLQIVDVAPPADQLRWHA